MQIGSGYEGDVFLVKEKNAKMIKKISRIDEKSIAPNTKYPIWREIDFNIFAKNYEDYFMILQKYSIDYNCTYKKKKPAWLIDKKEISDWQKLQSSPYCVTFLYTPVLDGTLGKIYETLDSKYKINRDAWLYPKQFYKVRFQLLFQQLWILYLLLENDWIHRDAHPGNWLYRKIKQPLKFGTYKINCPYKLYLCDYGAVIHKSYERGPMDEHFESDPTNDKYNDIMLNIINNVVDPMNFWIFSEKKKGKKFPDPMQFYKLLKKSPLAKNIQYKKTGYKFVDQHIFILLFKLKYYRESCKILGFDINDKKYENYLIQFTDWEYSIYEKITSLILEPKKLFEYLHMLCK